MLMLMVLMVMISRLMARLIALMLMALHDGANDNDVNANPLYSVCLGQTVKVLTVRYLAGRAGALGQLASTVQCCPGEGWFADVYIGSPCCIYSLCVSGPGSYLCPHYS